MSSHHMDSDDQIDIIEALLALSQALHIINLTMPAETAREVSQQVAIANGVVKTMLKRRMEQRDGADHG